MDDSVMVDSADSEDPSMLGYLACKMYCACKDTDRDRVKKGGLTPRSLCRRGVPRASPLPTAAHTMKLVSPRCPRASPLPTAAHTAKHANQTAHAATWLALHQGWAGRTGAAVADDSLARVRYPCR